MNAKAFETMRITIVNALDIAAINGAFAHLKTETQMQILNSKGALAVYEQRPEVKPATKTKPTKGKKNKVTK